jgi:hypothetical protein
MQTYTLQVRTHTKYGQRHSDTVRYDANDVAQAHKKGKKFATSAYGYNNITHIELRTIDVRWETNHHNKQEGIK